MRWEEKAPSSYYKYPLILTGAGCFVLGSIFSYSDQLQEYILRALDASRSFFCFVHLPAVIAEVLFYLLMLAMLLGSLFALFKFGIFGWNKPKIFEFIYIGCFSFLLGVSSLRTEVFGHFSSTGERITQVLDGVLFVGVLTFLSVSSIRKAIKKRRES